MVDALAGSAQQSGLQQDSLARLEAVLALQKSAQIKDGPPTLEIRRDRLERCIQALRDHSENLAAAISKDYGHRSRDWSLLSDVAGAIESLRFARDNLKDWMAPEKRKPSFPLWWFGARASVQFQPKGIIGIISPWNQPVVFALAPAAGALAAGNRVIIKPSEQTPHTAKALHEMISSVFHEEEIAVLQGGHPMAVAMVKYGVDHIVYTGAAAGARDIMAAAAETLTPVTLALGGKCPVIIGRSADVKMAAQRVMMGKLMNAGQICVAPDYVFVPAELLSAFVEHARDAVTAMYPAIQGNDDYTGIINEAHYKRLLALIEDAKAKASPVVEINPANENLSADPGRRIAPTLIISPADNVKAMQEEILGPVLPVKTYAQIDEAIAFIAARPHPLALYYFGEERGQECELVLANSLSGGVTINDVIFHAGQEDLPYGGIGPSGIGAYHGRDGFLEFSNRRAIYTQVKSDLTGTLRPPFGEKFRSYVRAQIGSAETDKKAE
ncbi:MAG: aldehyde dehydrogenase family protein [Caulobacterales bacterium]